MRQIAEEAGLGRAVIYRHFADRADLDRAIQGRVLERLLDHLAPQVELSGTHRGDHRAHRRRLRRRGPRSIPALHRIAAAERQDAAGPARGERAIRQIAEWVCRLITSGAELLEVELSAAGRRGPGPAGVRDRRQGRRGGALLAGPRVREPAVDVLAAQLARSVWFQIDGHARDRGVVLDPTVPLDGLVLERLRGR